MTLADTKTRCPGLYCGRQFTDSLNGSMAWNEIPCGACPRGYRVNFMSEYSQCMPCENNPSTYDWLYLGFMSMLPLILHWFFIDLAAKERRFVRKLMQLAYKLKSVHSYILQFYKRRNHRASQCVLRGSYFSHGNIADIRTILVIANPFMCG